MTIDQLETTATKIAHDMCLDVRIVRHMTRAITAAMAIRQGYDSDTVADYCTAHGVGVDTVRKVYGALGF